MKPENMEKISVTGHRNHLQKTIESLYRLKLLDIESYHGDMETGAPFEEAEELSQLQVRTRSLLSKMPDVEADENGSFQLAGWEERLDEIGKELEERRARISEIESDISELKDDRELLRSLKGTDLEIKDLNGTRTLESYIGKFDAEDLRKELLTERFQIFEGKEANVLFYHEEVREEINAALSEIKAEEMRALTTEAEGSVDEVATQLKSRIQQLKEDVEDEKQELEEKSGSWKAELLRAEEFLREKVEKAEAPLEFALTERAFIAEGWVPVESRKELDEELNRATGGKVHIQNEEPEEEPPTKYDNNRVVQPFESLTEMVSTPKYNELDPSFLIFLTFPALFGFMIGDAGYGITTFIVFYAGYKFMEGGQEIFKSLMWASFFTFIFGLIYGDAFGFIIFGESSILTEVTGMTIFQQIPIIFHRVDYMESVFVMAAAMGFIHVNLGFLLGFYNEYINHGLKEAFLEKISWILLQIGALAWYVYGFQVGAPILLISVVMLYVGEGIEGVVEIPSLLSNILSYLRIFGVSVAAIALASVANAIAQPVFGMGGTTGIVLGLLVLTVAHTFNTFIKIMEGFLQGIRLHYVEFFSKFYEGGGRRYAPFGAQT